MIDKKQVEDLINISVSAVQNALNKTKDSKFSEELKQEIYSSTDDIQSIVNDILKNNGVLSESQYNELYDKVSALKFKTLEEENKNNFKKYVTYFAIGLVVIGSLWYLSRK
jgi:hypothetical protein